MADNDNDGKGDKLIFIYAPTAESEESGFKAVTGEPNVTAPVNVLVGASGLTDYLAIKGSGDSYTSGTTKICTADNGDGAGILVYVWLEGTDEQAVLGVSDIETNPLSVTLNFVGVETNN